MKRSPKENIHIPLLDMDFTFYESDVNTVKALWKAGYHLHDIAERLERDGDEVFILLLDLARSKEIDPRSRGLYGKG